MLEKKNIIQIYSLIEQTDKRIIDNLYTVLRLTVDKARQKMNRR